MLKKDQDAYGRIMLDYLNGLPADEIVERDDGHVATSGGPASYFAAFADWPAHQRKAMEHVRGRALDIGCGAGRVCLHLEERGHDVVGIDVSPLAIETCKRRGVKDARVLPITQVGRRLGVFDTIVMLGNNFGLVGNMRRARWLLKRFRGVTRPGARIIAETIDPYGTTEPDHRAYLRANRRRGLLSGRLRLRIRYKCARTPWFEYLIVSRKEMEKIVRGTGWRVERYFDSKRAGVYAAVIGRED
jgi:SAM-dependent methyltransferase